MVVYRSIAYEHSCPPGGCSMCKENFSPPPENPRDHSFCCQYMDGGQEVVVVVVEQPLHIKGGGRLRPSTRRSAKRTERDHTLKPAAPPAKRAAPKKAAAKKTKKSPRSTGKR